MRLMSQALSPHREGTPSELGGEFSKVSTPFPPLASMFLQQIVFKVYIALLTF